MFLSKKVFYRGKKFELSTFSYSIKALYEKVLIIRKLVDLYPTWCYSRDSRYFSVGTFTLSNFGIVHLISDKNFNGIETLFVRQEKYINLDTTYLYMENNHL